MGIVNCYNKIIIQQIWWVSTHSKFQYHPKIFLSEFLNLFTLSHYYSYYQFNEYNIISRNSTQSKQWTVFKIFYVKLFANSLQKKIIEFWIILNSSQKRVPKLDTGMRDIWPVIHPKMHQMQVHPRSVQAARSSVISSLLCPVELSSKGFFPRWKFGVISKLRRTDVVHALEDVQRLRYIVDTLRFRFSLCVKLNCSWKCYSQLSRSRSW